MIDDRRNLWFPDLYYNHGGYFKIMASLILVHIGLGLDSLQSVPRHAKTFLILNSAFDNYLWILSLIHILIAALIITGMYWRNHFTLLRFGCGVSFIFFNVLAIAFAAAAYKYHLSYYSAIASVTLSLSSFAGVKEPEIQSNSR